ncbi:chromate transporter [Paeniroseomonas aquatica]|uniref:Chromate transporter n=1 Tax=Paeniroseomonas aquatica TaxID=373043 RepID=A0ABT8A3N3_9PROT|nr:chromate transporter [Paeniroseomonas aquatica]MDN3564355.1 chromate transporter [Paeniroseomonas aquatica]
MSHATVEALDQTKQAKADAEARLPSFAEALRVWLKIGLLSFGGPAGQIALLHREVVDERRWIGDRRFLHGLNFCTLLPGPGPNSSPHILAG